MLTKKLIRICAAIVLLLLVAPPSKAQTAAIKSFSEDSVKFIDELEQFFESMSTNKDAANDFLKEFKKFWGEGKKAICQYSEPQKQAIYRTCNLMLKKRMKPIPEFSGYLSSTMNFIKTKQPIESFTSWQNAVEKILNKSTKSFNDFISMSENLFATNSFFKSASSEWRTNTNKFSFEFDSLPKVVFPEMDLRGFNSQQDSMVIYKTKGVYYPSLLTFIGEGGTVTWEKTGLEKSKVYATLKKYKIKANTNSYIADSATLVNQFYFNKPLLGKLTDRAIKENPTNISFPQFDSYSKRFDMPNLAENLDYIGGFSMRGARFVGSGDNKDDAYVIIRRNGKPFIVLGSKGFTITKEKVTSDNVHLKIYLKGDSIYHPTLQFRFNIPQKSVSLIRTDDGLAKTPINNTYHVVDMNFEEIAWKTDEQKMEFKMLDGSTQLEADFESAAYFKDNRYYEIQGMAEVHPLIQIQEYVKKVNKVNDIKMDSLTRYRLTYSVEELTSHFKRTANDLRPLLAYLAVQGFLIYDAVKDVVTIKDRLFFYIKAKAGRIDYDVLHVHSAIHGISNATLNLLEDNFDLTIRGVKSILLSDSQKVFIYPRKGEIVMKKNRDFIFDGIVNAGRFEYFGKGFSFEYDKFKVNLTNVDSLRLIAETGEKNEEGKPKLARVKTVIEGISGDLLIDHPKNKSGIKPFSQYPIFNSFKESFVYYDKQSIQNGVYKRDNFYFKLEPFTIDSLDNFTNAALNFKGTFVSAGIFPDFKENLTLQSDFSLGFIRKTPPDGMDLYGGKGKFISTISLSNRGLKGDGDVNYLTSVTKSNDFNFYPDSMNTHAKTFDVAEQKAEVEFPQVHGEEVYIHWMPKKDIMNIHKKQNNLVCFKGQAEFAGRMDLEPKELSADGVMYFSSAELESKLMKLRQNKFTADTSDFRLKALEEASISFSTENVKADVDFDKRLGEFKSNGKASIVRFPQNQYICYMEVFKWFMDKASIELGTEGKENPEDAQNDDIDLTGPEFISVHPKQDSLRFHATSGKYDLRKSKISANDVKFIAVADCKIFPAKGEIIIDKNAEMRPLKDARIVANQATKYHTLYKCDLQINGKKSYEGSGLYDYTDELKQKQTLFFKKIGVDTTIQTYANADIPDTMKFMLSPYFEYKGSVNLLASNKGLTYNGACLISHDCKGIEKSWMKFSGEIDPEAIYIPVATEPTSLAGEKMATGIISSAVDSTHVYAAFLSRKKGKADLDVLPAEGFLFYDKTTKEYRISNKEKLVERSLPGNYMSLSTENCVVFGEGKMTMSPDLGRVSVETVGNVNHYVIADSTIFDAMMFIDFFFDDNAMDKMSDAINASTDLQPNNYSRPTFEKGLREYLGKETSDKLISQLNLYGKYKRLPDELKKTLVLSEVKLKWNKSTKSFVSEGPIGIGNINKNQVNKMVTGRIEIQKKKGGDVFNIYIEIDQNNWYFFSYTKGVMQAISSNDSFNKIIKDLKADKRELKKTEKSQQSYQFNLGTVDKKKTFLRRFN